MKDQEESSSRNHRRATLMSAAALHLQSIEDDEPKWGGSSEFREYTYRDRELTHQRLIAQYFSNPSRYQPNVFRRRYRMHPHVFDRMMHDVTNYDPYFVQTSDAIGRVGFSTEQKLTCAMRMLAYGTPIDSFDQSFGIVESTTIEILEHFTRVIWNIYHQEYLH